MAIDDVVVSVVVGFVAFGIILYLSEKYSLPYRNQELTKERQEKKDNQDSTSFSSYLAAERDTDRIDQPTNWFKIFDWLVFISLIIAFTIAMDSYVEGNVRRLVFSFFRRELELLNLHHFFTEEYISKAFNSKSDEL
jgi:hypothetical protein